jgi:potassium-transporting ATPase KdpC subunit
MKEFVRSLLIFIVMSLATGLVYPLVITGLSQAGFRQKAQGSLIVLDGKIKGSTLIGQQFADPGYFHGRPSATEKPYDAGNSGGSNLGPSNAKFLEEVSKRVEGIRKDNGLDPAGSVPADLVLASASGLDPHITYGAAMAQVRRVAKARGFPGEEVTNLVESRVEKPLFGFLGHKRINVLQLNMALDELEQSSNGPGKLVPGRR